MDWETFWWPHIAGALVSAAITGVLGTILGLIVRYYFKKNKDLFLRLLGLAVDHGEKTVINTEQAAQDASQTLSKVEQFDGRLKKIEHGWEYFLETQSADMGRRAKQELRFHQLEAEVKDSQRGKHYE